MPPHAEASLVCFGATHGLDYVPPQGEYSAKQWFDTVYPKLKSLHMAEQKRGVRDGIGLVEGVQQPGEIVYIPSGWWHLVINLEPTVAFTENFVTKRYIGHALSNMAFEGHQHTVVQWCRQLPMSWYPQCLWGVFKHLCCNFAECKSKWSMICFACFRCLQFQGYVGLHYH